MLMLALTSCAVHKASVAPWGSSQVFKLTRQAGMQWETLELREGRFRYWLSTDVIYRNRPTYPVEGDYKIRGDKLNLSSGQTYIVRQLHGIPTLWKSGYSQRNDINPYGILLPVEDIDSPEPSLTRIFPDRSFSVP